MLTPCADYAVFSRPVGMPRMEKVTVHNADTDNNLHLLSISGSTQHFHCSFFQDKVGIVKPSYFWPSIDSMLDQRRRCWASIESMLVQRRRCWATIESMLGQRRRCWASIDSMLDQRRRCWATIESMLDQRRRCWASIDSMLAQRRRCWPSIESMLGQRRRCWAGIESVSGQNFCVRIPAFCYEFEAGNGMLQKCYPHSVRIKIFTMVVDP